MSFSFFGQARYIMRANFYVSVKHLKIACLLSVFAASPSFAQGTFAPPPPAVTSPQWRTWYNTLLAQRIAEIPRARATTYYFSQSGNDTSGSGSIASPFRTLAKAQLLITQHQATGNVAFLFRRGDTWREQVGLQNSTPNITIADYGDAAAAKPKFTPFLSINTPAAWSPVVGQINVFSRTLLPDGLTPGLPVLWVKQDENRSRPYSRQQTIAGVAAAEGSFWYSSPTGTLYIHPRHSTTTGQATDPRTDGNDYQIIRSTGAGILVRGDGSRIENIIAEGWGMDITSPTQQHGIDCAVTGSARSLVIGCESYYNSSHAITHYVGGGGGGIATFINCRAGLCNYNRYGETVFNAFAAFGDSEVIFDSCFAAYGTLPSSEVLSSPGNDSSASTWDFNTQRRGQAFFGHTQGGTATFRLLVANNCSSDAGPHSVAAPAHFGNLKPFQKLEDARAFIVGEYFPGGQSANGLAIAGGDYVRIGGTYLNLIANAHPPGEQPGLTGTMAGFQQVGWAINNLIDIDASARIYEFSLYNAIPNNPSNLRLIGNFIRVHTGPMTQFRFDYDEPNQSAAAAAYNNIFVKTGPGIAYLNMGTGSGPGMPTVIGNAFFGFDFTGGFAQYTSGCRNVVLTIEPAFGIAPSCNSQLLFAADPLPLGIDPGIDYTTATKRRSTIGPIESDLCVDLDGDGRITAEDLYLWQRRPSDVNGDGQIDSADADLIERGIRWAESFVMGLAQNRVKQ